MMHLLIANYRTLASCVWFTGKFIATLHWIQLGKVLS